MYGESRRQGRLARCAGDHALSEGSKSVRTLARCSYQSPSKETRARRGRIYPHSKRQRLSAGAQKAGGILRSVYAKILGWSLVTLFISMTLVFVIGRQLDLHFFGAEYLFLRLQKLELDLTVKAWEAAGQTGAAAVIS